MLVLKNLVILTDQIETVLNFCCNHQKTLSSLVLKNYSFGFARL
jgi:hypothetical protein